MSVKSMLRVVGAYLDAKLRGRVRPLAAYYNVTFQCNLRCSFCSNWRMRISELGGLEALRAVKTICEYGVPALGFSGGEPLLRRDIYSLATLAKDYGLATSINTNGTLVDEWTAKKLAKTFDYVIVSIDGFQATHDSMRGVTGTQAKAVKAVEHLSRAGANVGVNTVIHPANLSEIPRLWLSLSSHVKYYSTQPVNPPPIGLEADGVRRLVRVLIQLWRRRLLALDVPELYMHGIPLYVAGAAPKICDAGKLYFALQPDGEIIPCSPGPDMIPASLGNILSTPLSEALNREANPEVWRRVEACSGCWLTCTTAISIYDRHPMEAVKRYLELSFATRAPRK
jgi:MoaA/NifB/PqqE/SkfB family radical SAM enzyme